MWRVWVVVASLVPSLALGGAGDPRFFVASRDGRLAVLNVHSGEEVSVTYRLPDGGYDPDAFRRLQHVFRSRGDGASGPLTPRFAELLGHVYEHGGRVPLRVLSGYRSPDYNAQVRARGGNAASASLHTEGMAADIALPKARLAPLWHYVRSLECCGAGYYAANGFLHVDVGQPRFWEAATSGVDQDLSSGNARVFARSDFDVYRESEPIVLAFHAVTAPPILVRPAIEPAGRIAEPAPDADGCVTVDATTRLVVRDVPAIEHRPLAIVPCEPRPGRTPERIPTNPVTVLGGNDPAVSR